MDGSPLLGFTADFESAMIVYLIYRLSVADPHDDYSDVTHCMKLDLKLEIRSDVGS